MNISQIKKDAPPDATHYRKFNRKIIFYKFTEYGWFKLQHGRAYRVYDLNGNMYEIGKLKNG